MSSVTIRTELTADMALFKEGARTAVALFYDSERPLRGFAGQLDWRFKGELSRFVKFNAISTEPGQITLIPTYLNQNRFQLFLYSKSNAAKTAERSPITVEEVKELNAKLLTLKITPIVLSLSDLGLSSAEILLKYFKGVDAWITQ